VSWDRFGILDSHNEHDFLVQNSGVLEQGGMSISLKQGGSARWECQWGKDFGRCKTLDAAVARGRAIYS